MILRELLVRVVKLFDGGRELDPFKRTTLGRSANNSHILRNIAFAKFFSTENFLLANLDISRSKWIKSDEKNILIRRIDREMENLAAPLPGSKGQELEGKEKNFIFLFAIRLFSRSHVPCTRARENKTRVGRFAYPVMNLNRPMNIYTAIRLFSSPVLCKKIVQWPNRKPTRPCLASAQEENRSRFRIIFISDPNEMRRRRM